MCGIDYLLIKFIPGHFCLCQESGDPAGISIQADAKKAFLFYAEALEIYKGDFLPDEIYASWADKKREDLRLKYIQLLGKMAGLYERQGAMKKAADCYKKAIQADPLIEESYQKLMNFYSNKGMNNEALRIYEDCRKVLKKELKTDPDSTTTAIYKKIKEKTRSLTVE